MRQNSNISRIKLKNPVDLVVKHVSIKNILRDLEVLHKKSLILNSNRRNQLCKKKCFFNNKKKKSKNAIKRKQKQFFGISSEYVSHMTDQLIPLLLPP